MHKGHIRHVLKFSVLVIIVAASVIFSIKFASMGFNPEFFKEYLLSFGNYSWLAALVLMIMFASAGLPILIPSAVSALLFGFIEAAAITYIGMIIGSMISFYIARFLGKEFIEEAVISKNARLKGIDHTLSKHGFWSILLSRLVVFLPFEIINVIAGVSEIRAKDFLFGSIIGILPGTFVSIYFIQSLKDTGNVQFVVSAVMVIIIVIAPFLSRKVRRLFLLAK